MHVCTRPHKLYRFTSNFWASFAIRDDNTLWYSAVKGMCVCVRDCVICMNINELKVRDINTVACVCAAVAALLHQVSCALCSNIIFGLIIHNVDKYKS